MKQLKYVYCIILTILLGLTSCVKDVEFEAEQSDPKLVVNGIQQVGQPARLCVERSLFFMDASEDRRVKDVHVDLYVNGAFKESLQVRDSVLSDIYYSWAIEDTVEYVYHAFNYCEGQYVLCAGDQLRFEVSSSEFDEKAVAEVTMPETPNVISFDTVRVDYTENVLPRTVTFSLVLDDPAGTDYYNIGPQEGLVGFTSSDPIFESFSEFDIEDMFDEGSDYYAHGYYNIISDAYFNGKTYTISMKTVSWGEEFYERFVLDVCRVDKNFYQYKRTVDAYYASDPESLVGMFTEPVQVYSNVENGIGVVCAQSQTVTYIIDLTEN